MDNSESKARFNFYTPAADYMEQNDMFKSIINSVNFFIIMIMFILSTIVVYSLMISDVNE